MWRYTVNDQLENLLYQSGLTAQGCWDELDDYAKQGIEKFAELIVRNNIQTLRSNGYDDAAQCLKDIHFGMDYPI